MSEKPILYTLKKTEKHQERLRDLRSLFIKTSGSLVLGPLALAGLYAFIPDFPVSISYILIAFGILVGINRWLFTKYQQLEVSGIILLALSFLSSSAIVVLSGGLQSPFIAVLLVISFGAYTVSRFSGILMVLVTILLLALISLGVVLPSATQLLQLSEGSSLVFTTGSYLFAILIFIGSIGHQLFEQHQRLYAEKAAVENRLLEKEMLLKEVHHRVKNNLQTVSSLLRMQGRSIDDQGTLHLIQSSQNRVVAMAMVHEMLYMREDLAKIDYRTYVSELGGYLIKSLKGPESKITLHIDIPEIELGIDTAIPLGLLINEAVTNALKYGFKDRETGEISILLEKENKTEYILRIGDNGVGYPESVTHKSTKSLGLKLIHNLSRQLQGSVMRDLSKEGTNYIIRFHELNPSSFHSLA